MGREPEPSALSLAPLAAPLRRACGLASLRAWPPCCAAAPIGACATVTCCSSWASTHAAGLPHPKVLAWQHRGGMLFVGRLYNRHVSGSA